MARRTMTSAQRAALRKAQQASARKRRRKKVVKRTAIGVGVFLGAAATKRLNKYADNPRLAVRDFKDTKRGFGKIKSRVRRRRGYKPVFQQGPWV